MALDIQSKIFDHLRAKRTPAGLTDAQLRRITAFIARSPTLTTRMNDFEAEKGCLCYSDSGTNYYHRNEAGLPCIYLDPGMYRNSVAGAEDANVESLVEVLAHETSHYLTYFKEALNPNECEACDDAGALGVRDEARAYATEYLVQSEINRTSGPQVDFMKTGQLEAIRPRVDLLPANASAQDILKAATCALIEWAANWSGPDESAGGYFEFYRNGWLKLADKPTEKIEGDSVRITHDEDGVISKVSFRRAGIMVAVDINRNLDTTTLA